MSASVKDVAALAGVSVGTVSNVLNRPEKVSADTVTRVHAAIDELGFIRNDAARQLRAGRSRSIGLIVLDVANPFFTDVARGAEDRAAEDHLSVLLGNSDDDPAREGAYLDLFEEQRVAGVLISPMGDAMPRLEQLRKRGTPTVLVDRQTEDTTFSSVSVDDVAGGYLAVRHLIDIGRRRIVFIGGPDSIRQVSDRLAGARTAVEEAVAAGIVVTLQVERTQSLTVLEGRAAGDRLQRGAIAGGGGAAAGAAAADPAAGDGGAGQPASQLPDAVFAANDLLAMGVLQSLSMLGRLRVPHDVALIGYDDIDFARAAVVPLSSIRQPSALIGHTAVDLLLREAAGGESFVPEQVVFQPELVVRESTAG